MNTELKQELTLRDLLRIFGNRVPLILSVAAAGFVIAFCAAMLTTRRYEAIATIQVEKQATDFLDMSSFMGSPVAVSDALSLDVDLQTEARVLTSESLAARTIKKLNLAQTSDFQTRQSLFGGLLHRIFSPGSGYPGQAGASSPGVLLKIFRSNLSVNPLPGTRLIEIRYFSSDPALAAAVANELAQEVIDYSFEMKFKTTQVNSEALSRQLAELKSRSELLQTKVAAMQRESGLYSTGATDPQGRQQSYSSILDQFQRASVILSEAEQNQILKQAVYQAAQSGNAEMLSGLSGNSGAGAGPAAANSLSTVQALRGQQATIEVQLQQLKAKFGSGYPKVAELEAEARSIETAIRQETDRIAKRAASDFQVADQTMKIARAHYNELKTQADALNDKAIHYMISRQEADESRTLYEELLKRLQQAGVMESLKSTSTSILDAATAPANPQKPNIPLYLAGGTFIAIGAALLVILVGYALDDRIRDARAVEGEGRFLAGILPVFVDHHAWSQVVCHPDSVYSEMLRSIRSALVDTTTEKSSRVILITSAVGAEGKSTFSIDLAANLTQRGLKVLLLEANFRSPSLRDRLGLGSTAFELSHLLTKEFAWDSLMTHPSLPGLHLVPAGVPTSNPAELLDSERLCALIARARTEFDAIILDGPPLLPVVDARALAKLSDITVQMVRCNVTTEKSFRHAADLLSQIQHGRSVCVLNAVDSKSTVFRSYVGQENALYREGRLQHEIV